MSATDEKPKKPRRPRREFTAEFKAGAVKLVQEGKSTLEPGKLADVVAVPSNPLEDIRKTEAVFFVMKEGVIHRDDTAPSPTPR